MTHEEKLNLFETTLAQFVMMAASTCFDKQGGKFNNTEVFDISIALAKCGAAVASGAGITQKQYADGIGIVLAADAAQRDAKLAAALKTHCRDEVMQ